jgi:HSP20 family protein
MLANPFDFRSSVREMERLRQEMNRLFDQVDRGPGTGVITGYPAMNIWSDADGVVVTAELPGVKLQDLDIAVQGNTLTLNGNRSRPEMGEDVVVHRQERGYGQFRRVLQLPFEVAADQVEAAYEHGVLRIQLPRAESAKPRKITVKQA